MGFAALSPHLGRPRAANPCTVFGVDFAVGVDFEQSSDIVVNIGSFMPNVRKPSEGVRTVGVTSPRGLQYMGGGLPPPHTPRDFRGAAPLELPAGEARGFCTEIKGFCAQTRNNLDFSAKIVDLDIETPVDFHIRLLVLRPPRR